MKHIVALLVLAVGIPSMGCIPRHPTKTHRPEISAPPWQERSVISPITSAEHRYLFAQGPSQDAPALLLLHGGFFDERIWINTRDLASRFNVYALAWPDDSPAYDGTFVGFGNVARDFLAALNIKRLVVVGVSMGSLAAIELVTGHADLEVQGLVVCSAVMLALSAEEIEARERIARIATNRSPERLAGFIEWKQARTKLIPPPEGPTQNDIFWVRPATYYAQVFGAVKNQGPRRQPTQRITAPVLLLSGTADETMPIEAVAQGVSFFSNARAVEMEAVEGADHSMVLASGPLVAGRMLGFFTRQGVLEELIQRDCAASSPHSCPPSSEKAFSPAK
ncbi:MAG: alpha/beta hydrolase [Myxococcota bacterium]|nr:alpha/beta hydrolase [Myxococcota bacterium]